MSLLRIYQLHRTNDLKNQGQCTSYWKHIDNQQQSLTFRFHPHPYKMGCLERNGIPEEQNILSVLSNYAMHEMQFNSTAKTALIHYSDAAIPRFNKLSLMHSFTTQQSQTIFCNAK